jgi:hypothetical protein
VANTYKTLGQAALTAVTLAAVYTVPAATNTVVSSVVVCNRGGTATTFRLSVAVAGAADATSQYLYYDVTLQANDTFTSTVGITLAATDVVRAYAGNGNVTVNLFGSEIA